MDSSEEENSSSNLVLAIIAGTFLALLIFAGLLYCVRSRLRRRNNDEESRREPNTCTGEKSVSDSVNKLFPLVRYGTLNRPGISQVAHTSHNSNCDLETPPKSVSQSRDQSLTVGSNTKLPHCISGRKSTHIMGSNEVGDMSSFDDSRSLEANVHLCVICINEFLGEDSVRVLTCGHIFHPSCIDTWFSNKHTWCPMCKADIYGSFPWVNGEGLASCQTSGWQSSTGQPTIPPAAITRDF